MDCPTRGFPFQRELFKKYRITKNNTIIIIVQRFFLQGDFLFKQNHSTNTE